CALWYSNHCVF
nr:immunoglobulin light chain junction region [Mus musculus]NSM03413.1 immunoglobulin light chain junction region [Mus musculus]